MGVALAGLFKMLQMGFFGAVISLILIAGVVYVGSIAFKMAEKEARENVKTAVKVSVISGGIAFLILPMIVGWVGLLAGVWAGIQGNNAGWIGAGMSLFSMVTGALTAAAMA
jgi:hypothetical protein